MSFFLGKFFYWLVETVRKFWKIYSVWDSFKRRDTDAYLKFDSAKEKHNIVSTVFLANFD